MFLLCVLLLSTGSCLMVELNRTASVLDQPSSQAKWQTSQADRNLASILGMLDPDPENSDSDSKWFFRSSVTGDRRGEISDVNKPPLKPMTHGTTRHLREIFIGRCFEYQYRKGIMAETEWNCGYLWHMFSKAFKFKDPCNVTQADYSPFFDQIEEDVPANKALVWSGTRELAHKFSDFLYSNRFTTLEDTLAGYLVNGMEWCGSTSQPGINYKSCPWECAIQAPYWSMANIRFTMKLKGLVHILLNGTRQHLSDGKIYPAYMKHRYYLGPHMVPLFTSSRISKVIIIVAHTLNMPSLENCGEKSVLILEEEIKSRGIPVECYDDPDIVRHILCIDDPMSRSCRSVQ